MTIVFYAIIIKLVLKGFTDVEAFTQVRATRPGSIQSRPQIASVSNFFEVLKQLRTWPLKTLSVDELYLRGMKAYNKHELLALIPQ
jgi:hypothetical protein